MGYFVLCGWDEAGNCIAQVHQEDADFTEEGYASIDLSNSRRSLRALRSEADIIAHKWRTLTPYNVPAVGV